MEDICARLQVLRSALGMSQVEFARPLGVTNAHISKIEKGKTVPSDSLVKLICRVYNVNELWLKHGNQPMRVAEIEDKNEDMLTEYTREFNDFLLRSKNVYIRNAIANIQMMFLLIVDSGLQEDDKSIEYLSICESLFGIISDVVLLIRNGIPNQNEMALSDNEIHSLLDDYKIKIFDNINSMASFFKPK